MAMKKRDRPCSFLTHIALRLMAGQIRVGRKERGWTTQALANRAVISRATLQRIEKGDPGVAVGLVFEVATLVGVPLFEPEPDPLRYYALEARIARIDDKLALLPQRVRKREIPVDDDF